METDTEARLYKENYELRNQIEKLQSALAVFKKHSDSQKTELFNAMWTLAVEQLNPTMQIWLSKQMLGYKDRVD